MADGGVATEVRKIEVPQKPREIRRVDPQRHALEALAAEKAAVIARGEDHAREEAEKVRKALEAESQPVSTAPKLESYIPEEVTVHVHGVKIHAHPGEIPFDPITHKPAVSGEGEELKEK
jgi:hypothetical protein